MKNPFPAMIFINVHKQPHEVAITTSSCMKPMTWSMFQG